MPTLKILFGNRHARLNLPRCPFSELSKIARVWVYIRDGVVKAVKRPAALFKTNHLLPAGTRFSTCPKEIFFYAYLYGVRFRSQLLDSVLRTTMKGPYILSSYTAMSFCAENLIMFLCRIRLRKVF
jgi:hypothetical protein